MDSQDIMLHPSHLKWLQSQQEAFNLASLEKGIRILCLYAQQGGDEEAIFAKGDQDVPLGDGDSLQMLTVGLYQSQRDWLAAMQSKHKKSDASAVIGQIVSFLQSAPHTTLKHVFENIWCKNPRNCSNAACSSKHMEN